jgi:Flp pilus assembly protein TadG
MEKKKFPRKEKSAQAMVEFAIALPVLLLLLYGILEAGRLLFMYSTVVTASRQAARYGATTGEGNSGVFRYQDCDGIRAAANAVGYLGEFDSITLAYDQGVTNASPPIPIAYTSYCSGQTDSSLNTSILQGNRTRLVVTVTERFYPIVPKLVPFIERDITSSSARTILYSVPIVVEQDEAEWFKTPTELVITADTPDPSEINQSVNVSVKVTGGNPTGTVEISGADVNCQITLDTNGEGNCNVIFSNAGFPVITAFYSGDEDHLASSDTEDHTVTLINTTTTILSDLPDFSIEDQPFVVVVQVTGSITPTGTVEVDGGGSVRCTITLSNGAGGCTLSYGSAGNYTLTATYNGSSTHLPSSDTEPHQVLQATPTPTRTPTATPIPTQTPIPTATRTPTPISTPTLIPTPVPSCNLVRAGAISRSGNIMSITVNNPYAFNIVMKDITVTWNDDKGHQSGGDKTLRLQRVDVGGVTIWTGNIGNQSTFTIPTTAILAPGTTTISFHFHQSYDNLDGTERVYINLLTPGCEGSPIDTNR